MKTSNRKRKLYTAMLLLICLFPNLGFPQDRETESHYYLFPAAVRLAGIGTIYGVGFYLENIASSTIDFGGGKSAGRIDATGTAVRDINFFDDNFSLTIGVLQVNKLMMDISYTRGMADDDPVTQQGSAQGGAISGRWNFFEPTAVLNTTVVSWGFKFDDYLSQGDEATIEMPKIHLSDLNAVLIINDLTFNFTDSDVNPRSGLKLGLSHTQFNTGTQFSSTSTISYFINGYLPLGESFSFVLRGFGSDAAVTSRKTTDLDEIKNILAVDCSQVTDAAKQTECQNLTDNLAAYILAHNENGTAALLGGDNMLRSYREGRVRGAHARFWGSELRYDIPFKTFITQFQTAIFHEQGSATDNLSELGDVTRSSSGLAVRLSLDELTVRLETANGDEGQEWFLTFGNPW
ncbi:MAG: hypothetical protein HN580_26815 [Deltaproteobacteria bacterium]|nr:hypothetical protein [Deltaproteobacteria bacterium]